MAQYHHVWTPKPTVTVTPITHWTDEAWKWMCAHLPHLKMIGITLAIVVVVFGVARGYSQFRENAATQLFVQSATNDATPPQSVLETVANKYPRTAAGKYADWLLATQYYQEGKFAEAAKYYERLAERTSTHRLYHVISSEGEAYAFERQGEYVKAAALFTQVSKISENPFADQDIINAARNEFLAGKKDVAAQLLKSSKDPSAATQLLVMETGLVP